MARGIDADRPWSRARRRGESREASSGTDAESLVESSGRVLADGLQCAPGQREREREQI